MREFGLSVHDLERWRGGDTAPLVAALKRLGCPEDELNELASALTTTLATPVISGTLAIRQASGERSVDLALGSGLLALQPPNVGHADAVVVATVPMDLPRLIAELVDLGPRPYEPSTESVLVPSDVLDAHAGSGLPRETLAELEGLFDAIYPSAALGAILGEHSVRWVLTLWSDVDTVDPESRLDVIDAGPGGLWMLSPADEPGYGEATPVSSSAVWMLLGRVLESALATAR